MSSDNVQVGKATAKNLTAIIEDYNKEKIVIDADIEATGDDLKSIF